MCLKITSTVIVLITTIGRTTTEDSTTLSSNVPQNSEKEPYITESSRKEEVSQFGFKEVYSTSPSFPDYDLLGISNGERDGGNQVHLSNKQPQYVTEVTRPKSRRDVPTSSYNKFEYDDDVNFKLDEPTTAPETTTKEAFSEETFNSDGSFSRTFKTKDGIFSRVSGYQKTIEGGEQGQAMEGQYSYSAPDGSVVDVRWKADEQGFHAQSPGVPLFRMRFGR